MDREIVDAVTEWESTPFSGGYEGLHGLADREFSGVITEGSAWAFMLNGRLIGIKEGSISAFAEADGTAYESPAPGLPLLYAMQGRGEEQAQYYTNEKPISEADTTLSSGNFTGYIELSENVLSGDYYTVYYGGKSMSVAFVGNSRKLLTDEKAFERADDEVGIYTVYAVDLEVIEIPEPEPDSRTTPASEESADSTDVDEPLEDGASEQESVEDGASEQESVEDGASEQESAGDESTEDGASETGSSPPSDPDGSQSEPNTADSRARRTEPPEQTSKTNGETGATQSTAAGSSAAVSDSDDAQNQDESVFSDEAKWRNTNTIPSLDPSGDPNGANGTQSATRQSPSKAKQRQSSPGSQPRSKKQLQRRLKRAEQVMQKAEEQHKRLISERDSAREERDEARDELQRVKTQLSEAEAEIERLETQLESGQPVGTNDESASGRNIGTTEALDGTNLLVRYASKGDATLEDAISGNATQEDVRANIRIEPHTTFEIGGLTVDGTPFETFLEGRIELAFTRWLVEAFLFDIQQTGNQTNLSGIYKTLPAINRAELHGSVSLGTDEEEDPIEAEFDLVVRDKRDQPLFIADFNESKQSVGSGMINSLIRDGSEIIQRDESFAGAFAVTTSYYKGDALDAAADATGGGLLSASRGKSFVYISRKQGFHLCLVEKLGDTFDLHVPEL